MSLPCIVCGGSHILLLEYHGHSYCEDCFKARPANNKDVEAEQLLKFMRRM